MWLSGSDNTLLEPWRGLTLPLSSPKAILPPFLFLVKLQWFCAMIPYIKPSIFLFPFCSTSCFLRYTPSLFFAKICSLFLPSSPLVISFFLDYKNQSIEGSTVCYVALMLHSKIMKAEQEKKSVILDHS